MGLMTGKRGLIMGLANDKSIAWGIAKALAAEGAELAFSYQGEALLKRVQPLASSLGSTLMIPCDVADEARVQQVVAAAASALGPIDILVNNAGVTRDGYLMLMDREKWDAVLRPNLDGAFFCTRAVVRSMLVRRWGRVISLTSPSAVAGLPGQANYAASKGGLIGLTRTLSRELAPKGVLVNAVMPGLIETDMTAAIPEATREAHLRNVPVGRLGTAADVAEVVAFLSSDAAAYITGQVIGVDGGLV